MSGIVKSIIWSILAAIIVLAFVSMAYFLPWYMTLIVETFNLSQVAATDNYVSRDAYDTTLERIKDMPIFNQEADKIEIIVAQDEGDTTSTALEPTGGITESNKPYRQRGEPITVTISAQYPLQVRVWGKRIKKLIPVSFKITTVGLKHYKDLEYYDDLDGLYDDY